MHNQNERRHRQAGFTLVEIMVVIVILGLLATIVGTNVLGARDVAEVEKAKTDITNIKSAVDLWSLMNSGRGVPTLEDLRTRDSKGKIWLQQEVDPKDPWGNEYVIVESEDSPSGFEIVSYGPDGDEGTTDDITSRNLAGSEER